MGRKIRPYIPDDLPGMIKIWNEVVAKGDAFPQTEELSGESGRNFFASQTRCAVAIDENGNINGLYILHPNNIGRCGHIANASFAVAETARGNGVGEKLVLDCLKHGHEYGFRILQFNAVVKSNMPARKLYEKLGFKLLGEIPGGFLSKDKKYLDICLYWHSL